MVITVAIMFGRFHLVTFIRNPGYTVFRLGCYKCRCVLYYEQGHLVLFGKLIKEGKHETSNSSSRSEHRKSERV
jgi:hypothetical protein